ncbi:hypothetical protein CONCODRAFT_67405 [Conidiobolus coronatus NRRL 28638]|uniref:Uncharacterized protein n=1 Tax=Conidiobolus coronatus (strain ATCC 28846 / CBS 209.66 / NRRL 28638) TaxID=796925 RepID=A0A137PHT1_CONC2|nr:hypothetical protein CONCODRAFT_67405 [Conidiobolus coronatus NRRL 28638]|eukprot:KXN74542.1 hypothetical protein CONCODRAFT_67405 [Conidiobolus coronatus NRRL 28638]
MTEILGNKGTPPKSVLDKIAETPYPALITSLACFAATPFATYRGAAIIAGMPSRFQTVGFGSIFAGVGYISSTGDVYNSTGIATAWSLTYCILNLKQTVFTSPRHILPMALTSTVVTQGIIYGQRYYRDYFGLE